jgi:hypothetical protein
MLYRIVVNVINVSVEVMLVPNQMLPEAAVPHIAFMPITSRSGDVFW